MIGYPSENPIWLITSTALILLLFLTACSASPQAVAQPAAPQVVSSPTLSPLPTAAQKDKGSPKFFSLQEQRVAGQESVSEHISHETAASLVEYSLKEPQSLPDGYQFSDAIHFSKNQNILLMYTYQPEPKGEMILLTLSPVLIQDEVDPDAKIEKITVNGFEGEMVRGWWMALAGEDHETWESQMPVTTLRWFDGEIYIKLQFHLNEPSSPSYLDLSQMLTVAESIH